MMQVDDNSSNNILRQIKGFAIDILYSIRSSGTERGGQGYEALLLLFDPVRWGRCEGGSNSMNGWNRKTQPAQENSKMPLKCGHYLKPSEHSAPQQQSCVQCRISSECCMKSLSSLCFITAFHYLTFRRMAWGMKSSNDLMIISSVYF